MTMLRAAALGRRTRRPLRLLAVAVVLAGLVGLVPSVASDALGATPQLTVTSSATYTVQPDKALVHVALDAVAVSHTQDTQTKRFYFTSAYVTVLPGTSNFSATYGSTRLAVRVTSRTKDYVLLMVTFDRRLYSGQSYGFRIQFDLVDPGGAPTRDIRVGSSLVSFPVWAFASSNVPGSRVRVILPAGFQPEPGNGDFPPPTTTSSGQVVYDSGPLTAPLDFYAYLMADRPGAFAQTSVDLSIGGREASVVVKAWSDDARWGKQVADLFRRGLPALASLIGLPYPRTDQLTVEEAVSRSLGGYSGLFDPKQGRIQVAYYAEPFVVLHEAAHVWFNSDLGSDRWIDEAFASYYAEQAAKQLGIKFAPTALTPALLRSRIQLNDWGAVGGEAQGIEDYAYAATSTLANLIAQRAGAAGLARVWQAAANHEAAYQPIHTAGLSPQVSTLGAPDWRVLLDLLEERTARDFSDLWRQWVVRPSDAPLLDERAKARDHYRATVATAGTWELPAPIRSALGAWQFGDAEQLLGQADRALALRDEVDRRATADHLTPPTTLRRLFESPGGLQPAIAEGENELTALSTIEAARAAATAHQQAGVPAQVGLIGRDPQAQLAASVAAFSAGDLVASVTDASLARDAWAGAGGLGQSRLTAVVAGLVAALVIILVGMWLIRRRRTAPFPVGVAGATSAPDNGDGARLAVVDPSATVGPYATLGPDPRAVVPDSGSVASRPDPASLVAPTPADFDDGDAQHGGGERG